MSTTPTRPYVQFTDIETTPPDLEALALRADEVCASLSSADEVSDCIAALRVWDDVRREVSTHDALVDLRFNQDTRNAVRKAALEAWHEMSPRWTALETQVKRALLAHPLRKQIESKTGAQAFSLWESEVLAFDQTIIDDLATELALAAEYKELLATAEFNFRGEELSLSTISKYSQHADREVRHEAERLTWNWYETNGATLDRIFDELTSLRAGMARKLGLPDFVDLGYKRMCRIDYDRTDVERFRAEIVNEVVPLCTELVTRQAKDLGVDTLMSWDENVHDPRGNPAPGGDAAWQAERAQNMFDAMGPELGDFFRRMDRGGFLDLESRKGKAGGGFCTAFPTHGMPFVYANFNGTKGDVEVLTHEVGHAFQCYSSQSQWPSDYHWATYESCEVHSMSLEFLTWPHMDKFFGEDGARFKKTHLTDALLFLPYGTAVDHFQHEIYTRPDASPAERHAIWQRMERTYLPWRNWGDLEFPKKGGRWQRQGHIYADPFYYIDYVLAQTCALQFWARSERDPKGALEAYVELCGRGGSLPFQALVRSAGLTSPFDEGCLTGVVAHARRTLEI